MTTVLEINLLLHMTSKTSSSRQTEVGIIRDVLRSMRDLKELGKARWKFDGHWPAHLAVTTGMAEYVDRKM